MEKQIDTQDLIDKRLLENRKIFLWGDVDEKSAKHVIERLLFLELQDDSKEIKLIINSGGGEVYSGMAIHDIMTGLNSPISTICCGHAMSMASIILSAGQKGRRFILPFSKVMIHQPIWGVNGQASDIEIRTKELLRIKKYGAEIISRNCNQPFEKVMRDKDRDYYMDSEEAIKYGIVDNVINNVL